MISKKLLIDQWYFSDVPGDYLVTYTSSDFMLRFCDGDKVMLEVFNFVTREMYRLVREPEGNYTITIKPIVEVAEGYEIPDSTDEVRWATFQQKHDLMEIVRNISARRSAPLPEAQLNGMRHMLTVLDAADIYNPGRLVFEK